MIDDEIVPVASAQNPLVGQVHLRLSDILTQPLALREAGSGSLEVLLGYFSQQK